MQTRLCTVSRRCSSPLRSWSSAWLWRATEAQRGAARAWVQTGELVRRHWPTSAGPGRGAPGMVCTSRSFAAKEDPGAPLQRFRSARQGLPWAVFEEIGRSRPRCPCAKEHRPHPEAWTRDSAAWSKSLDGHALLSSATRRASCAGISPRHGQPALWGGLCHAANVRWWSSRTQSASAWLAASRAAPRRGRTRALAGAGPKRKPAQEVAPLFSTTSPALRSPAFRRA